MEDSEYLEPKFTFRQASRAAAFPLNALRSYYQRGWFKSLGKGLEPGRGRASRLCLGDILVLAIASRLMDLGLRAVPAYNAAFPFGVTSRTPKGYSRRKIFDLFDRSKFYTYFSWRPGAAPRVFPSEAGCGLPAAELGVDDDFGAGVIVLCLNHIEATVFKNLGLRVPDQSGD